MWTQVIHRSGTWCRTTAGPFGLAVVRRSAFRVRASHPTVLVHCKLEQETWNPSDRNCRGMVATIVRLISPSRLTFTSQPPSWRTFHSLIPVSRMLRQPVRRLHVAEELPANPRQSNLVPLDEPADGLRLYFRVCYPRQLDFELSRNRSTDLAPAGRVVAAAGVALRRDHLRARPGSRADQHPHQSLRPAADGRESLGNDPDRR